MKVKIELSEKDAYFVAEVLHRPHLDMTEEQYEKAKKIGNIFAEKLKEIRKSRGYWTKRKQEEALLGKVAE